MLLAQGCATPAPAPRSAELHFEGRVTAVDMTPWTYDGNAVIRVASDASGTIAVELPARWNLCRAQAVESPETLQGRRVRVVARATEPGRAVLCESAEHRIERLP
ncbi:hypothetical protein GCM10027188_09300 [Lysobacter humi (ex Lee et al. 2017)]